MSWFRWIPGGIYIYVHMHMYVYIYIYMHWVYFRPSNSQFHKYFFFESISSTHVFAFVSCVLCLPFFLSFALAPFLSSPLTFLLFATLLSADLNLEPQWPVDVVSRSTCNGETHKARIPWYYLRWDCVSVNMFCVTLLASYQLGWVLSSISVKRQCRLTIPSVR